MKPLTIEELNAKIEAQLADILQNPAFSQARAAAVFRNNIAFDISFRGYDRRQVEDYINAVTKDYNEICEKNAELIKRNKSLNGALSVLNIREESEAAI